MTNVTASAEPVLQRGDQQAIGAIEIAAGVEQRLALVPHRRGVFRIDGQRAFECGERVIDAMLVAQDEALVVERAGGLRVVAVPAAERVDSLEPM